MPGWTNADNKFGPSSFIVGTPANGLGNGVNYTSIQSALNDAPVGSTIYIRPGTYVENITFKNQVSLYGVSGSNGLTNRVQISGSSTVDASLAPVTAIQFENISFVGTASDAFSTINSGLVRLIFRNCTFSSAGGFGGLNLNNPSGTFSIVALIDCLVNGSDFGVFAQFHQNVTCFNCNINGGTNAGFILNATSRGTLDDCRINSTGNHAIIVNGTALETQFCHIISNVGLAYQVNGTAALFAYHDTCESPDPSGFFVSGTGSFQYANIVNTQNVDIDPALTVTVYDWKPYGEAGAAPGTGVAKGTACYDSAVFSVVNGFVSSPSGGGFVETISADGSTATPTTGNIGFVSQSGANLGFSAPSTILVRAPLYTQANASGLMNGDNVVYFTTNAITLQLPGTVQDGLCNGVVVTDANPVIVTPSVGTSKIRIGANISSAGGTATSTSIGDVLVLRYNTVDDIWYGTEVVGAWLLA